MSTIDDTTLPLVIQIENLETTEQSAHAFTKSPVHIGRNELNDLPLRNDFVSLWHAVVRFDEGSIKYVDLGSTNGTQFKGRRIDYNQPIEVREGETLEIGPLRLSFSRDPELVAQVQADAQYATQFQLPPEWAPEEPNPSAEPVPTRALNSAGLLKEPVPQTGAPQPRGARTPTPTAPSTSEPATILTQSPFQTWSTPQKPTPQPPGLAPRKEAPKPPSSPARKAVDELMPLYARFCDSWKALRVDMMKKLGALPAPELASAAELVRTEMPELLNEDPLQEVRRVLGMEASFPEPKAAASPGGSAADDAASKLLARLARSYVPKSRFSSSTDAVKMLEQVADVLETCAKAFVELRKGHGQFAEHMAVRKSQHETPLHNASNAREVLEYVLDWSPGGRARVAELMRGFTEVMLHEIALLNGLREGVKALLSRLSPEEIEQSVPRGPLGVLARWKRYVERYHDLTDEEQLTTSALFGPEFARAYAIAMGEAIPKKDK